VEIETTSNLGPGVLSSTGSASAFSRMLSQIESTSASLSSTGKLRIASSDLAVHPALARCHRQSPPPRFVRRQVHREPPGRWPGLAWVPSALATFGYVWLRVATFSGTDAVPCTVAGCPCTGGRGPSDARTDCRRSHERSQLRQADLHARCTPVRDPAGPVRTPEPLLTWVFASN
jgi:hypothetical protein